MKSQAGRLSNDKNIFMINAQTAVNFNARKNQNDTILTAND